MVSRARSTQLAFVSDRMMPVSHFLSACVAENSRSIFAGEYLPVLTRFTPSLRGATRLKVISLKQIRGLHDLGRQTNTLILGFPLTTFTMMEVVFVTQLGCARS